MKENLDKILAEVVARGTLFHSALQDYKDEIQAYSKTEAGKKIRSGAEESIFTTDRISSVVQMFLEDSADFLASKRQKQT